MWIHFNGVGGVGGVGCFPKVYIIIHPSRVSRQYIFIKVYQFYLPYLPYLPQKAPNV